VPWAVQASLVLLAQQDLRVHEVRKDQWDDEVTPVILDSEEQMVSQEEPDQLDQLVILGPKVQLEV